MASELVASKSAYCDENTFDCRVHVFWSQYADLDATSSDAIIFKTKDFFWIFIAFLKSIWNGEHFQKKGESSSLSIPEIIDSKRGGYLSAWKPYFRTAFGKQPVNE